MGKAENGKEALERFYRLTVGKELKTIELKKKILELEGKEKLKNKILIF